MADEELSAGLLNAMETPTGGDSEATTEPSAEATSEHTYSTEGLSPYATNWLAQLPEAERPKAAEYVKNWDQGFQSYSQRVGSQLTPYTQLGSAEELAQIKSFFDQLKADPQGTFEQLAEAGLIKMGPPNAGTPAGQQQYYDAEGNPVTLPGQAPPEFESKFKRIENALGTLAQQQAAQVQQREQAEASRQLDEQLTAAKAKHGPFNEMYVLARMQQGETAMQAALAWKNEINAAVAAQKAPPVVMSASSAPPPVSGPLNSSEDRKRALLQFLDQS